LNPTPRPRVRDRNVAAAHYLSLCNLPGANARQRRRMNRYRRGRKV